MHLLAIAIIAFVAVVLGCLQAVSSVVLRENARGGSLATHTPGLLARAIDGLDPRLPIPSTLCLPFARAALAKHDFACA